MKIRKQHDSFPNIRKFFSICLFLIFFTVFKLNADIQEDFFSAVNEGNISGVQKFLDNGFNINTIDTFNMYSALHYAVEKSDEKMIKFLITKGINLELRDKQFSTAMNKAVDSENKNLLKIFLDLGANKAGAIMVRALYTLDCRNSDMANCQLQFSISFSNELPQSINEINFDIIIRNDKAEVIYKENFTKKINLPPNEMVTTGFLSLKNKLDLSKIIDTYKTDIEVKSVK